MTTITTTPDVSSLVNGPYGRGCPTYAHNLVNGRPGR